MSDTVKPTIINLQHRTKQFTVYTNSHKAAAELHLLARFGSNFTTLSWVGHIIR